MKACATCKYRVELGGALGAGGFVGCKFRPDWDYVPGQTPCRLVPVRWERIS